MTQKIRKENKIIKNLKYTDKITHSKGDADPLARKYLIGNTKTCHFHRSIDP